MTVSLPGPQFEIIERGPDLWNVLEGRIGDGLPYRWRMTCQCGVVKELITGIPVEWRCVCGEPYYWDPATRLFQREFIEAAHTTSGLFASLFKRTRE